MTGRTTIELRTGAVVLDGVSDVESVVLTSVTAGLYGLRVRYVCGTYVLYPWMNVVSVEFVPEAV